MVWQKRQYKWIVPKSSAGTLKVELDLVAKKVDWANLKSDVARLDIDKLKNVPNDLSNLKSRENKLNVDTLVTVPVDLCKLSGLIKNYVIKKDVYNPQITYIEDKIADITNLATNASLNAKINEVKVKKPDNLATTTTTITALTTVGNKILIL